MESKITRKQIKEIAEKEIVKFLETATKEEVKEKVMTLLFDTCQRKRFIEGLKNKAENEQNTNKQ